MICPKRLVPCLDDLCRGGSTLCGFDGMLRQCRECKQLTEEEELNAFDICWECRESEPEEYDEEELGE